MTEERTHKMSENSIIAIADASPIDSQPITAEPIARKDCVICGAASTRSIDELHLCQTCANLLHEVSPPPTSGDMCCWVCHEPGSPFQDADGDGLPCGCEVCEECFRGWAKAKVDDMCTVIKCPMQGLSVRNSRKCTWPLDQRVVEHALQGLPEVLRKYRAMRADLSPSPFVKSCPGCGMVAVHGGREPLITCCDCGMEWCFPCHAQHPASTCREFAARRKPEEIRQAKWRSKHTRPCPSCSTAIQRIEGCAHMHCVLCDTHFCYKCGLRLADGDVAPYYHRKLCRKRSKHRGLKVAAAVVLIPVVVPMFLVVVAGVGIYQVANGTVNAAKRRVKRTKPVADGATDEGETVASAE